MVDSLSIPKLSFGGQLPFTIFSGAHAPAEASKSSSCLLLGICFKLQHDLTLCCLKRDDSMYIYIYMQNGALLVGGFNPCRFFALVKLDQIGSFPPSTGFYN